MSRAERKAIVDEIYRNQPAEVISKETLYNLPDSMLLARLERVYEKPKVIDWGNN